MNVGSRSTPGAPDSPGGESRRGSPGLNGGEPFGPVAGAIQSILLSLNSPDAVCDVVRRSAAVTREGRGSAELICRPDMTDAGPS
jgi:hypothetical protein